MVTLNLYTAYIKNVEKPNNLIIIARPESGKTEVLKKFIANKHVAYLTDLTAHGLQQDYFAKIESGQVRHLIVPDLLKPLSRRESTVRTLITTLNALIEEGMTSYSTYAGSRKSNKAVKCGIITAITDQELNDQRHSWGRLGFLSRVIPFSYSYGIENVKHVFDSILGLRYLNKKNVELQVPKKDKEIKLPRKYASHSTVNRYDSESARDLRL